MAEELPELLFPGAEAWRRWLAVHHATAPGAWVVIAKKGTTEPTDLSYDQALDEALCQGWVDGSIRRRDERTYATRFTPRRARSNWSASNVANVERLTAAGRMQPAGTAAVDRARASGRWPTVEG